MSIPVIICDDSNMARKQMWRALPVDWDFEVTFAGNGEEALTAIERGECELMFLDLTMPVMDGFEVLEALKLRGSSVKVIVVSGDIQPDSYRKVMDLGALEFIKKPFETIALLDLLDSILDKKNDLSPAPEAVPDKEPVSFNVSTTEVFGEIANIAMGRAADLMARYLEAFVVMPIPHVNMIDANEIRMVVEHTQDTENSFAVCQGFVSPEASGEALSIYTGTDFNDLAELLKYDQAINEQARRELAMDITTIMVGAVLKSLSEQLDIGFCQSSPMVMGHDIDRTGMMNNIRTTWRETLAVEMFFTVEGKKVFCDFILVFNITSIDKLNERLALLAE